MNGLISFTIIVQENTWDFLLFAKRIRTEIMRNFGEHAEEYMKAWDMYFCADGVHLINGYDAFEMPVLVSQLTDIIHGGR